MADYFEEMGRTPLLDGETPDHFMHLARLLRDFGMFHELGEDVRLPPPTSPKVIEELTDVKQNRNDVQCTVCLKEFNIGENAKSLPCDHEFHPDCIIPWLKKTSTCPLCRLDLPTDDEQYEEYKREKKREKQREQEIELLHNSMFS